MTASTNRPSEIYFLSQVWGDDYVDVFANTVIPSLMAAGNLPAFVEHFRCTLLLFTTPNGEARFRRSRGYRELGAILDVQFRNMEHLFDDESRHHVMSACHAEGIREANQRRAGIIFLMPDNLIADGGFAHLAKIIKSGKRIVNVTPVRAELEKATPFVEKERGPDKWSLHIPPRRLVDIFRENIHPSHLDQVIIDDRLPYSPYRMFGHVELDLSFAPPTRSHSTFTPQK